MVPLQPGWPRQVIRFSSESLTVSSLPGAPVLTVLSMLKAAVFGRYSTVAGWPGWVGVMVTSTRFSFTRTGVTSSWPLGTR